MTGLMHRLFLALLALLFALAAPAAAQKRIALSFDDVPRAPGTFMTPQERTDRLTAAPGPGGGARRCAGRASRRPPSSSIRAIFSSPGAPAARRRSPPTFAPVMSSAITAG